MKQTYYLTILLISIVFVSLLLLIPEENKKKVVRMRDNYLTSIETITSNVDSNYKLEKKTLLSNNILNLVYKDEVNNKYKTYFIDHATGALTNYYSIIKFGFIDEFNKIEESLLNYKYPRFIVDGILNSDTKREVVIDSNKIVIYYYNVVTAPMYNDELFLTINNHEVSHILDYEFKLDSEYENESGYDLDLSKKYIALSFDDGPSRSNTPVILNALLENKMKATFFEVGNFMVNNQDIVKNLYDNGMEIGSHTYSHINMRRTKSDKTLDELNKTNDLYNSITGDTFKLLRPPYGAVNDQIKDTYPYSYILWSLDTNDWRYKDADYVFNYVINNVKDGDIVLMHDIHPTTKDAVLRMLPELYVRGFRVVTVSELATIKGYTLENNTIYRSFK